MKKPKKNRKYTINGIIFNTFQGLKRYIYFNTPLNQIKIGYEIEEDVITKRYIFTKQERRLICEKTYDKDEEELKKWNNRQQKLF